LSEKRVLKEMNCKGCQEDCWGKEYDPEEKKYFCIANGFYIQQKERVEFT